MAEKAFRNFPGRSLRKIMKSFLQTHPKFLMITAILLLGLVYFVPIWQIALHAPQYPEGLGMRIWIHTVTGQNPNDLNTINGLNHYIGMQEIHAESIPELKIMPWLIAALMVLGFSALFLPRWFTWIWVGLFVILLVAGLVDFYLWGYDYGHNLNPDAAIRVPGLTYQPPLIGSKQLLNIRAVSLPHWGAIFMGFSLVFGFLYGWFSPKKDIQ
jgi:copper chaperone NosL